MKKDTYRWVIILFSFVVCLIILPSQVLVSQSINKLGMKEGSILFVNGTVKKYDGGNIWYGILENETRFKSNILPANTKIELDEKGRLATCTLSKPAKIGTVEVPAKTQAWFNENEDLLLIQLSEPWKIYGVPCAPDYVSFDEFGKIKYCTLDVDFALHGFTLHKGTIVYLNKNGWLEQCILSHETDISKQLTFPSNTTLRFIRRGTIASAILGDQWTYRNREFPVGSLIEFNEQEIVVKCLLSQPTTLNGSQCAADWVYFYPNGNLQMFRLPSVKTDEWQTETPKVYIQGIGLPALSIVWMYETGELFRCDLNQPVSINNYACAAKPVYFYKNGKLKQLTLNETIVFRAVTYAQNDTICLDERNRLIPCGDDVDADKIYDYSRRIRELNEEEKKSPSSESKDAKEDEVKTEAPKETKLEADAKKDLLKEDEKFKKEQEEKKALEKSEKRDDQRTGFKR